MTFTEKADRLAARLGNNVDYLNTINIQKLNVEEQKALVQLKQHADAYSEALSSLMIEAPQLVKRGKQGTVMSILRSIEDYNSIVEKLEI